MFGYLQNCQDIALQIGQFRHEAITPAVRQAHLTTYHMLELLKQIFGPGRPVILLIGHEIIKPFIPCPNVLPSGTLD